ncbi:hypothetical protein FACS189434_06710 [Bacteroidia bacterium]|nr:hypothetical protein FACS189434_06710 [Bacteroidia bacterium]
MKRLIGKPVVIRGYYCGNWAGILEEVQSENKTVVLSDAYRLWNWTAKDGICLSAIANNGVTDGKISKPVTLVQLGDCYEVIAATDAAMESIKKQSER